MSTQKKTPGQPSTGSNQNLEIDQNLLDEIGLLSKSMSELVTIDSNMAEPALIARLVEMNTERWLNFTGKHNLQSWFVIPLRQNAAEAITMLSHTMEKLAYQRDHDVLTGLANRRYLENYLHLEMERAKRTNAFLSLVMLDLDHFKHINDTYGHPCGDKVLQKLGDFLKKSQRSYDLAARYGGEEFMLVLPGLSSWKAKNAAERILHEFIMVEFGCGELPPFSMSFSGGVAGIGPDTGYNLSSEEFIKQADEALYAAKHQGRNRIVMTREMAEPPAATMVLSEEKQFLFGNME